MSAHLPRDPDAPAGGEVDPIDRAAPGAEALPNPAGKNPDIGTGPGSDTSSPVAAGDSDEVLLAGPHGRFRELGLLFRAARDMKLRLENTRARLVETSERPSGDLRVTTTVGLGTSWLSQRVSEFLDLYPDVRIELVLTNEELDLAMREADIAIRMRRPAQPDLIQRRLFTVHYHAFASPDYVKRFGEPKTIADLDEHRLVSFGGNEPSYLLATHYLASIGREGDDRRPVHFTVNNIAALHKAMEAGIGVGILPDYAVDGNESLVQVLRESEMPTMESYLVYAEEMRSVARVQAFRDFLVNKAQRWTY